jgi:hypothetical protein
MHVALNTHKNEHHLEEYIYIYVYIYIYMYICLRLDTTNFTIVSNYKVN